MPLIARRCSGHPSGALGLGLAVSFAVCPLPARGAACAISGDAVTLDGVTVQPRGASALTVGLYELPVIAKPSASSSAPANLEIDGAIAFRGQRRRLWYSLREAISANEGMLRLERGTRLVDARARGTALLASVVLRAEVRLEGTDIHPELVARPVSIACSQLTLDSFFVESPSVPLGDGTWWVPRANSRNIVLRALPDARAQTLILSGAPLSAQRPFGLERVEQRGDWMQVAYAADGATVRGWVRGSQWATDPNEGSVTSDGAADSSVPDYEMHYAVPARYEGPARIAVGTVIYAEPGRGPWATVRHDVGFRVRDDGSAWVELSDIPGVAVAGAQAYVPRKAVELPQP